MAHIQTLDRRTKLIFHKPACPCSTTSDDDKPAAGTSPTGCETEQEIEVPREEIVQEYLQGLKIVDRLSDEENKVCSATAFMLKNQIQPKPARDRLEPTPTVNP